MSESIARLAAVIAEAGDPSGLALVYGTVTTTGTGGLTTVTVSGDATPISGVKVLNAANPTAGSKVAILRCGTDLLVLGTV